MTLKVKSQDDLNNIIYFPREYIITVSQIS